ncbi:MAG: Ribonuclease HII [Acidobacteria bacterium ADurb.Bin340]|nr:MAG: Ribonuclease HII [Acidobacteria bacterium ADurb.Bin340]HOD33728.1 ribonuclease HII [Holophaga sp.]
MKTPRRTLLEWDLGHVPPGLPWAGVDEAGRGAWAGPVVAACAVLTREAVERWGHVLQGARDSKQMGPDKREALAAELKVVLPAWSIAEVDNLAIDRENILEATLQAMRKSLREAAIPPRLVFVDGDRAPRSGLPERLLVEGDATSCAVACASILAKTHRDARMRELESEAPGYGFDRHKGYGTADHRKALQIQGAGPWHRLSYAPVAALQRPDADLRKQTEAALEACADVAALQAWVEGVLRPAYGALRLAWIEALRQRYAERLAALAGDGPS